MALNSPGIGSGLDINGIVSQLMTAERQPLVLLARQEGVLQAKLSAFGQIRGAADAFRSAAEALSGAGSSTALRASSADTTALTASASEAAVIGTYEITVTRLARAQALASIGQASVSSAIGSGAATTITMDFGTISGGSFDSGTGTYSGATLTPNADAGAVSIEIDGTNNTLEKIRDAINAAGSGVTAAIVNDGSSTPYRLVLSSDETGAANSLRIAVTGDASIATLLAHDPSGTQNLVQTQAAQNALISVNGLSLEAASNTVSDLIPGVTLDLLKSGAGAIALKVERDTGQLESAFSALVKAYNGLASTLGNATAEKAILQGDASALSAQSQLHRALSAKQTGTSGIATTLSDLGVSVGRNGLLALDTGKLDKALAANHADVASLATRFGDALASAASALAGDQGSLASRSTGITGSLADIADRREALNLRFELVEKRYRAQFAALDSLLSNLNRTSSFLLQQLQATNTNK